jgi:predicted GH43/DUF377 family glycosyl hydrolase
MHRWRKLGLVFNPLDHPGRPWLDGFAQAPSTVLLDDRIRVYFSCRPPADADGSYVSYSAWVDLDRADPTRVLKVADEPVLDLGETGTFDEFGTYPFSVVRDGDLYRGYYAGWTRCESVPFNTAIGMATSRDGARFERYGRGPIIGYTPDEPFVMSGPKIRRFDGTWYLFYIAGRLWKVVDGRPEPVYKIRMATSADGICWTKLGRDLIESRVEPDEAQASPDVFFHNGRYHMFFCYRYSSHYRGREFGYRIGYAHSTDLVRWTRDDGLAGIDISVQGWDAEMISYPHVFQTDGRIFMAYLGNEVGRHGFGLAELEGELT